MSRKEKEQADEIKGLKIKVVDSEVTVSDHIKKIFELEDSVARNVLKEKEQADEIENKNEEIKHLRGSDEKFQTLKRITENKNKNTFALSEEIKHLRTNLKEAAEAFEKLESSKSISNTVMFKKGENRKPKDGYRFVSGPGGKGLIEVKIDGKK